MDAVAASILATAGVFGYIMAVSSSPAVREAIRRIDPRFEDVYFASQATRPLLIGGLRIFEAFRKPPEPLASSNDFMSSLRLVRIFLVVTAVSVLALAIVLVVT